MILYDWKCTSCQHEFEGLGALEQRERECPKCTGYASRLVSAPRSELEGRSGAFPDAAAKWEKLHTPKSRGGSAPNINYFDE